MLGHYTTAPRHASWGMRHEGSKCAQFVSTLRVAGEWLTAWAYDIRDVAGLAWDGTLVERAPVPGMDAALDGPALGVERATQRDGRATRGRAGRTAALVAATEAVRRVAGARARTRAWERARHGAGVRGGRGLRFTRSGGASVVHSQRTSQPRRQRAASIWARWTPRHVLHLRAPILRRVDEGVHNVIGLALMLQFYNARVRPVAPLCC